MITNKIKIFADKGSPMKRQRSFEYKLRVNPLSSTAYIVPKDRLYYKTIYCILSKFDDQTVRLERFEVITAKVHRMCPNLVNLTQ